MNTKVVWSLSLVCLLALASIAGEPKIRTRILTSSGGANQWFASYGVTNVAYTNSYVYLTLQEAQSFFVPGDEVRIVFSADTYVDNRFFKVRSASANKVILNILAASSNYTAGVGWVSLQEDISTATVMGLKHPRTNNLGTVYVGVSTNALSQPINVAPGEWVVIEPPQQNQLSLTNLAIAVDTNADGVVMFYFPRP